MKLKKNFKPKLKKNKFSLKDKEPVVSKEKDTGLLPCSDKTEYQICKDLHDAGLRRSFQIGDRIYSEGNDFVEIFVDYKMAETLDEDSVFWRPEIENLFQILKNEYEYYPTAVTQARKNPNYAVAFTKLRINPKVELLGVVQAKSESFFIATAECLLKVMQGKSSPNWKIW